VQNLPSTAVDYFIEVCYIVYIWINARNNTNGEADRRDNVVVGAIRFGKADFLLRVGHSRSAPVGNIVYGQSASDANDCSLKTAYVIGVIP
jgi:hypothetical protein